MYKRASYLASALLVNVAYVHLTGTPIPNLHVYTHLPYLLLTACQLLSCVMLSDKQHLLGDLLNFTRIKNIGNSY